jgi:uncharacterized protein
LRSYVEFILKFRWVVITLILLITAFLVMQWKHLEIIIDPDSVLPQSHPYVIGTNKVEKVFGSKFIAVVGITPKSGDIFQPHVLQKVQDFTREIRDKPGVVKENLLSLAANKAKDIRGNADGMEVRPLMAKVPRTPEQMAELKGAIERNPAYLNSIVSKDFKSAAIIVDMQKGDTGFRGMLDTITPIADKIRDDSVEVNIAGLPSFLSRIEIFSERVVIFFPIAIVLIGLILFEAFRTFQGLFLPLLTAILATLWGVGIMGLSGIPMDVFNSSTPILILAVAAGHAVQLLKRYYEEYHHMRDTTSLTPKEANHAAVISSVTKVGPVMLTAGGIAALGFFSLIVFEIVSVRTFGLFTGIGILSALIIEMTFMPALRSLLPAPGKMEYKGSQKNRFWDAITGGIADWVTGPKRNYLFVLTAVLMVIAAFGMSRVLVDSATKSFFADDFDFKKDDQILNERLGGTNTLNLIIEGKDSDAIKDPRVLQGIEATQRFAEAQPDVGKTISIADFVKRMNQAMNGDDPKFYAIPDNQELISQYLFLYSMSGEPGDFDSYVDYDYKVANLTVFLKTDSSAYVQELIGKLKDFTKQKLPDTVTVGFGGSVPAGAGLTEVMVHDKVLNIVQIASVVFVVSSLVFRSLIGGLLVLTPLLLAVLANFGVMGWTGMRLNIPNALSSAMAVGIGADYAIYLVYRLREEISQGVDEITAVRHVLATAGKACLFVASAVAVGYGVLWFSPGFYVHSWLATLIACSMLVSVFAALTLIPALVLVFRPKFIFNGATMNLKPATAVAALVALGLGATLIPMESKAADPTAIEIAEKNFMVSKVVDSTSDATFTLTNKNGQERIRKTYGTSKLQSNGVDNMRMTRFLTPSDVKGTVSLLIENSAKDDDIWIYLPALKKVRRLVSSNKKDSFVGTDFSYGDVIGHKPSEWNHKIVKEEDCEGKPCWVTEATPKSDEVKNNSGYSKRLGWILKENFVAVKAEFYDESGQLVKTSKFSDIRLVDKERNKWQPMRLESVNVQTGHKTVIQFQNFKANQNVKEDFFTTRYMERDS